MIQSTQKFQGILSLWFSRLTNIDNSIQKILIKKRLIEYQNTLCDGETKIASLKLYVRLPFLGLTNIPPHQLLENVFSNKKIRILSPWPLTSKVNLKTLSSKTFIDISTNFFLWTLWLNVQTAVLPQNWLDRLDILLEVTIVKSLFVLNWWGFYNY